MIKRNVGFPLKPDFFFEWPVYAQYNFIPFTKYAERLNMAERTQFQYDLAPHLPKVNLSWEKFIIIVPSGPKRYEHPLKRGVHLFTSFANLKHTLSTGDMKAVQEWLLKFGLPFSKPSLAADKNEKIAFSYGHPKDSLIGFNLTIEGMLYNRFGHYVMLESSLVHLIKEAYDLLNTLYILNGEELDDTGTWVKADAKRSLSQEELSILSNKFRNKMASYMAGTSPILSSPADNPNIFESSWQINTLWTAMIILFHDSVVKQYPIRRCQNENCNKLLAADNMNRIYCEHDEYGTRSSCQNAQNSRRYREKLKKAAEAARKNPR